MRSFATFFVFLICAFEIVLAIPTPLPPKSKAVSRKSTPAKKVHLGGAGVTKKNNSHKKTKPVKAKGGKTKTGKTKTTGAKKGAHGPSCPLKRPAPPKVKREEEDFGYTSLSRRTASEFLGFHGTSSTTAAEYMSAGRTGKHLPILGRGFNGNDAELGPGLYVTDHVETAMFFAISAANARKVKGEHVTPSVCMVEAIGTTAWRTQTPKIWVPHDKIAKSVGGKNDPAKIKQQDDIATCAGYKPAETVRFSVLDIVNAAAGKPPVSGNQFSIPTTQFNKIYIRTCFDVTGKTEKDVLAYFQQQGWPNHDFNSATIRGNWKIAS